MTVCGLHRINRIELIPILTLKLDQVYITSFYRIEYILVFPKPVSENFFKAIPQKKASPQTGSLNANAFRLLKCKLRSTQ